MSSARKIHGFAFALIFMALSFMMAPHEAFAFWAAQPAQHLPQNTYPGYANEQFFAPDSMIGQLNNATYPFNCAQDMSGNDTCVDSGNSAIIYYCSPPYGSGGDSPQVGGKLIYGCVLGNAPVVTGISPASAPNNAPVSISSVTGSNFLIGASVSLVQGATVLTCSSFTLFNSSTLTSGSCPINGVATGQWDVVVTNAPYRTIDAGKLVNGFTVLPPGPAPTITSISPNTGWNFTTSNFSSIIGSNFTNTPSVTAVKLTRTGYTDISCSFAYSSATQLINGSCATTGAATGQWNVVVTNPDGQTATLVNGVTINADTTPPTVPQSLVASPVPTTNTVYLQWTASTDGGSGMKGYNVYRNGVKITAAVYTGGFPFTDTGLTANTTYSYTVTAVDNAGNESAQSTPLSVTTAQFTYTLSILTAGTGTGSVTCTPGPCTTAYTSGTSVTLTATPSGSSVFAGWSAGTGSASACTGTGSCTFTITANSGVTATFNQLPPTVITNFPPTSITNTSAIISGSVNANGAAGTYFFRYSAINGTCGSLAATTASTPFPSGNTAVTYSQTISGLTPSTQYFYCIVASNTAGTSFGSVQSFNTNATIYTLSVSTAGTGTGTITFTPLGTSCGTNCQSYTSGTSVTLTATPSGSSVFAGWSAGTGSASACTGTGSCTFTITANSSVTSTFNLPTYTLSILTAGTGTGSVTCTPGPCTTAYTSGTSVTLTATPSGSSVFAGWSAGTGSASACTGTGSCTFTITANSSVTSTFNLPTYTLSILTAGTGTGTVAVNPPTGPYTSGTSITLTATPSGSSTFGGFSGACVSAVATCTFTITSNAVVTATFNLPGYTLSVTVSGSGSVASSPAGIACPTACSTTFVSGTTITLTETPGTMTFSGWSGACTGTTATCTFTITANSSVTATFADTTPPIFTPTTTTSWPSGTLSVQLAGTTNEGATCKYTDVNTGIVATFSSDLMGPTLSHSQAIATADGVTYTYNITCTDVAGNVSLPKSVSFSVASVLPTAPAISGGQPSGTLPSGTLSATLSVVTNQPAYCKYSNPQIGTGPSTDNTYANLPNTFTNADPTHFTATITGFTNGTTYTYYVRCQSNPGGVSNTASYQINFSVALPGDQPPIAVFTTTPTSGSAPLAVAVDASASSDPNDPGGPGTIVEYIWSWGDGSATTSASALNTHTYTMAGTYTISLTVVDNGNLSQSSGSASQIVTVSAPPPPVVAMICTAACTSDAQCISPNICGPSGICINPAGAGGGPLRFDGAFAALDGSNFQYAPAQFDAHTTTLYMSVRTDMDSTCQYILNTPNTFYGDSTMTQFTKTGGTTHTVKIAGLRPGGTMTAPVAQTYNYYVKCKYTASGDFNTSDYPVSVTISAANQILPPANYLCLVNQSFVKKNIPYFYDVCMRQCVTDADCKTAQTPNSTCDTVKKVCR